MIDLVGNVGRAAYGIAGLLIFLWWRRRQDAPRWFWPVLWAVTRVGSAVLLFGILDLPAPTDASEAYLDQARASANGLLPYRDFDSNFAPLFAPVLGLLFRAWGSPYVFVAFAILLEALLLLLWHRWPPKIAAGEAPRVGLAAYLCSTLPLNTVLMGQDEIGLALVVTALFIALDRASWLSAAVGTGAMLVVTKFTSLLYVPFLAWRSGHLLRFTVVTLLVALPVYAGFLVVGIDVLSPVHAEVGLYTNGNLLFLIDAFADGFRSNARVDRLALIVLFGVLAALFVFYWRKRQPTTNAAFEAIVIAQLLFLLLYKKSYHTYLVQVMPAFWIIVAQRTPRLVPWALILTALSTMQQSLYFRLTRFGSQPASGASAPWVDALLLAHEAIIVVGYCALTIALFRAGEDRG